MKTSRKQSALACSLVLVVASASLPAFAQSAADKATAGALFDEGKKLVTQGKFAEACAKFELSEKLDPGVGTLGSLADCYEQAGKTASAWGAWRETATAAAAKGQSGREAFARGKVAALESKVPKLVIVVPSASSVSGLEIRRDGEPVLKDLWGTPLSVDPGKHTIEARAAGMKTYATEVDVAGEGAQASVTIPPLVAGTNDGATGPSSPTDSTATPTSTPTSTATSTSIASDTSSASTSSSWSSQKTAALVVGGAGIVGLGLGTFFGLRAKSKNSDADANCNPNDSTRCTATGLSLADDAHSAATISTIAFIAGGAAIAGSVILWVTAPKSSDASGSATSGAVPSGLNFGVGFGVAHGGLGLTAQGAF